METEPNGIEPKIEVEEKNEASETKKPQTLGAAVSSWFTKVVEFDSKKATEGYLKDPWARPLGH